MKISYECYPISRYSMIIKNKKGLIEITAIEIFYFKSNMKSNLVKFEIR